jgi:hypothetical protein
VIKHISFKSDVVINVGTRDIFTLNVWSREKHNSQCELEQDGEWLRFYPMLEPGKRRGDRIDVPLTSVASIHHASVDKPTVTPIPTVKR